MPKQQALMRRGARFFCNNRVPKDLRQAMGKEHGREALGTCGYREACRKVPAAFFRQIGLADLLTPTRIL